jgi:uncharacterized OB-fold protein
MQAIKLIDRHQGGERQLGYAAGDAQQSWFLQRFQEQGKVGAQMCPECGRILLYAEPRQEE